MKADPRRRFRDLYPAFAPRLGFHPTGRWNAITDVPGVEVGHATVIDPERGHYTGVTAIWPRRDAYEFRPRASGHVLHGAGEMTGFVQAKQWGLLETPILLTSTLNIGKVHDAVVEYLVEKHPRMGLEEQVVIPVVAECDDSRLSRARDRAVGEAEVREALDSAASGPVEEGSVGAGTGMVSFGLKGGIGTASRRVRVGEGDLARDFTLGALVNSNVGQLRQLRLAGDPAGIELDRRGLERPGHERSIIVVLATDAPMRPDQLEQLSVRAGMGLARSGSYASYGSGEITIAFTTSVGEPREPREPVRSIQSLHDAFLNPFYEAAVECVEECVLNAMASADDFQGRDEQRVRSLLALWKPLV